MTVQRIENRVYHDIRYPKSVRSVRTLVDVTIDGVTYSRAGEYGPHGVFMESSRWPNVPPGDEGLFIFEDEQRMIPLAQMKSKYEQRVVNFGEPAGSR